MTVLSIACAIGALVVSAAAAEGLTEFEFAHLALLNQLRKEGYTCPYGTVFPPNDVPLVWNCALWRASRIHSLDMATNDFFDHQSPATGSPGDRASAQNTRWSSENIAAGNSQPEATLYQWQRSNGHCLGMMDPNRKSMAVGFAMNIDASYYFYWTQMTSNYDPEAENQDCIDDSGVVPAPLPSAVPTPYPTVDGAVGQDLMDFKIHNYEMQVLDLINQARKEGNQEECYGEFYTDLPPLEWNCGLFRAARTHMADCVANDKWSRTGTDGMTPAKWVEAEGIPDSCASFMVSGYQSPIRFVERLIQMACWAVFGEEYKSFGVAAYRDYFEATPSMPDSAWIPIFNRHSNAVAPDAQTPNCQARDDLADPTPAPTAEATPAPTAEPTPAPSAAPTMAPVEEPTEPAVLDCGDYSEKKACKGDSACCWKNESCKSKAKMCPKQSKEKKCVKYGCLWDSESEVCSVE